MATWTREPEQDQRDPAEPQLGQPVQPAAEQRTRRGSRSGSRTGRTCASAQAALRSAARIASSWTTCSARWPTTMNRSGIVRDRHLAAARMEPASRQLGRRQRPPARGRTGSARRRSGRTARAAGATGRARGSRSGPRRSPIRPNGTGSGRPGQDALDLAEPVRRHLGEVGEDLARPPARLVRIVVDRGHRPGRAGLDRRAGGGQPGPCRLESFESVSSIARQCGTPGVALDGQDHRSVAPRVAADRRRTAAETCR